MNQGVQTVHVKIDLGKAPSAGPGEDAGSSQPTGLTFKGKGSGKCSMNIEAVFPFSSVGEAVHSGRYLPVLTLDGV